MKLQNCHISLTTVLFVLCLMLLIFVGFRSIKDGSGSSNNSCQNEKFRNADASADVKADGCGGTTF